MSLNPNSEYGRSNDCPQGGGLRATVPGEGFRGTVEQATTEAARKKLRTDDDVDAYDARELVLLKMHDGAGVTFDSFWKGAVRDLSGPCPVRSMAISAD